jgi:uncharacterized membrane protein
MTEIRRRSLTQTSVRWLITLTLLASLGWILNRWFLSLFDLRVHAAIVGVAALYMGLGDVLAWNTISNLDKVLSDTGTLPVRHLIDLTARVRNDRRLMLRRLKWLVALKGVALAIAPAVFDVNISNTTKHALLIAGYLIIGVSGPLLLSMFRDYEATAAFRDQLIVDECARRGETAREPAGDPHDFAGDQSLENYYKVVEPQNAAQG